jgi:hypothetical protein
MLNILSKTKPYLMNTMIDQQFKSSQMDLDLSQTMTSTSIVPNDRLNQTIDVLMGSIQVLNDDTQQNNSETLRDQYSLELLLEDLSKVKLAIEETNTSIEGFKPSQQLLLQDFSSLKQDVEDHQATSYDGTFIWRITDVQKKMGMNILHLF